MLQSGCGNEIRAGHKCLLALTDIVKNLLLKLLLQGNAKAEELNSQTSQAH